MNNTGLALCCGKPPTIGDHNYHSYKGQHNLHGWGYYCESCHKSASVLSSNHGLEGMAFAAEHWNRRFQAEDNPEPAINAPAGWRWASLGIEWRWMGGKLETGFPHVLFWTANPHLTKSKDGYECFIDDSRHHRDLKLMNLAGHQEDLSWLNQHKKMSAYAYTGTSWCTDRSTWYRLSLQFQSDKWVYKCGHQIKNLTGIDLVEKRNNPPSIWQ